MATDYSPAHIARMAEEFADAAQALNITLPPVGERPGSELDRGSPSPSDRGSRSPSEISELVVALLEASSDWSAVSGTRASGPFGAFLAGAHPNARAGTADSACAHVGRIISMLSHADE